MGGRLGELDGANSALIPPWEDKADQIGGSRDDPCVEELLLNKHFQQLADLSKALEDMASAAKTIDGVSLLDKDSLSKAKALSTLATQTVTLTFALFHLHVAVPKLKGPRNQGACAEQLRTQIQAKRTWEQLPKGFETAINALIEQAGAGKASSSTD